MINVDKMRNQTGNVVAAEIDIDEVSADAMAGRTDELLDGLKAALRADASLALDGWDAADWSHDRAWRGPVRGQGPDISREAVRIALTRVTEMINTLEDLQEELIRDQEATGGTLQELGDALGLSRGGAQSRRAKALFTAPAEATETPDAYTDYPELRTVRGGVFRPRPFTVGGTE